MKRLFVVNLNQPCLSAYRNWESIGAWMWGRSIKNHPMFIVDCSTKDMTQIITKGVTDIIELQSIINEAMKEDDN